jgi:GntR family transcriptional regulator / MocR family aminotransferase
MAPKKEPVLGADLLLAVERRSPGRLHEQLERNLRELVRGGRLAPRERLPSSRALAEQLGISRGVVLEAYAQLIAEGYLTASQGAPTRVASAPSTERAPVQASSLEPRQAYPFDPGLPDLAAFPRDGWLRSLRAALARAPFATLGASDPRGLPELRDELMRYVGRVRGAAPEPEHTIICGGFTAGLAILCRTLRGRGLERIAVEEPGWARHRLVAEVAGLEPVPVAVDADGLDVAELAGSDCDVVIVTPAHQFPTGAVLSSERRAALLDWAEDRDALIVEDDYDAELRYDRTPVGALQGLGPERVCHIGSASIRLAPGIRIGWILSPSWLTGALSYEKAVGDGGSDVPAQLALADFIARGELDRHLRRMRLRYRERRAALIAAVARELPDVAFPGIPAGTFQLVTLGEGIEESGLLSAAAARGVGIDGLAWHRIRAGPGSGLVLGFGNLSVPAIERGVALLGEAARAVAEAFRPPAATAE